MDEDVINILLLDTTVASKHNVSLRLYLYSYMTN